MITFESDVHPKEPIPIGNAANLHILRTNKFKSAVCCLLIRRPLSRDESTKNAVLSGILRQGCIKYPSIPKINSLMEELFGSVFDCQIVKKGEEQIIQLYFEGIPDGGNILKGIEFLLEVLLNPLTEGNGFKPETVFNAKNNVKNAVEGRINNKAEYARNNCLATICEGEPFAVFADGSAEDLADLNADNLYQHYKEVLATSPIELICAGNLDEAELTAAASGLNIPNRTPISIPFAKRGPARTDVKIISENLNSAQSKICMGLRSDISPTSRQFYSLLMMNEILGGGPVSKLFTKIRERESLCYYINSTLYRFKSIILIQTGAAAGQFDHIVNLTGREIEEIRQGCVTREEWDAARQSLNSKFRSGLDHFSSILDFYTVQYLLNDKKSVMDILNEIDSVTLDETAEAAGYVKLDTAYELK